MSLHTGKNSIYMFVCIYITTRNKSTVKDQPLKVYQTKFNAKNHMGHKI